MTASASVRDFPVGPFAESAAMWLSSSDHPEESVPKPAATVLLVRGAPLEVFMIERAATMQFAPSTWVFPGGRVDPADAEWDLPGDDMQRLSRMAARIGEPVKATASWVVAAVRELFEEAGVLLAAVTADAAPVSTADKIWASRRLEVEAHRLGFREALEGLRLRLDLVEPVDRWITPAFETRRYDTLFLLAALPQGAQADAATREAQQGKWVQPREMLEAADRGEVQLLPPTRTRLLSLCAHSDAATALEWARNGGAIRATRPWPEQGEDGPFLRAEVNP